MPDARKILTYWHVIIIFLILAVYGNTLQHDFVWDDINIIVDHPLLSDLGNIPKLFMAEDVADAPTGYYRPITYISFALERAVWGLNPIGYNITNLLLYILTALMFNRVILLIFKNERLALIASLLFALHPLAGETVNFHAGGRNTLLCACFILLAMLFHTGNRQIPALVAFTLAIFSKEFALLTPVLFVLTDRYVTQDKKPWLRYLPYALSIAGYLALRSYVVTTRGNLLEAINIADTVWIIPQIFGTYLANMAWPFSLKTMYDVNTVISWTSFTSWAMLSAGLIVIAAVYRKRREVPAAVVVFLLFLTPVSNIVPLGITMMADRYAFFALFGFCLGLGYLVQLTGNRCAIALTLAFCTIFATIDIRRNGYWQNEITFFSQMIKDAPQMSVGFQNLGYAYDNKRDYPNADKYLSLALTKNGINSRMLTGSASMFWNMNKLDKALQALHQKIALEPNSTEAYIMASRIYEEKGDTGSAKSYRAKASKVFPGIFQLMAQRAVTACRNGEELLAARRSLAAERYFREALEIDPSFVPALLDLGGLLAENGDTVKALEYFQKAARLEPDNPAVHFNLAQIFEMTGKPTEALNEKLHYEQLSAKTGVAPRQGEQSLRTKQ